MYITLKHTISQIERRIPEHGTAGMAELRKMYDLTLRLQSQLLSVMYDMETYSITAQQEQGRFANRQSVGKNEGCAVTLVIHEPLPSMKRLTEALEDHWKSMIHAAISSTARQESLPYFEKAMVEIIIITPRGTNNAKVWDTSNRAINLVINNLKGIFFRDDDLEHMAFSVLGQWGEKGVTILRISELDESRHFRGNRFFPKNEFPMSIEESHREQSLS